VFEGTFDGNGFTISGIYVNSESDYQGLFAASSGTIKNLGVIASYVEGRSHVGGLAGNNYGRGEISNSYYVGDVVGDGYDAGGIAGGNGGAIRNSYSIGAVTGDHVVGGLAGSNFGTIDNSYSASAVTGRKWNVGGLAGENNRTISNSYSIGAVTGGEYDTGGLVGENNGIISNSYSIGAVTGTGKVGGLVGLSERSHLDECSKIINCYYNKETGGQKGIGFNEILKSWDEYRSEGYCVNKGEVKGKTTAEMKQKATFKGWDFESVWKMDADANSGYPYLR
jgi:hypothetical protein